MSKQSIKSAAVINIFGKYSSIIINLVYSAILSRLLSPLEFGVVAVVLVFVSFFSLFANMGIGPAVIQNKNLDEEDVKSIFSFTLYIAIIISLLFAILSYPISYFYNNDVYIGIGFLLSLALFFNTINIVPNALFLKAHKFKLVAFRTVFVGIITAIPTIYLATIGFSYYSIVIHSILVASITFFWNGLTSRKIIGIKFRWSSVNKIKEFSKYQYVFSIINYFSRNLDNLLIGRFIGESPLGYYNKSYQLMQYPIQNITHAITPVLHPILSLLENQHEIIYEKYIKILKLLSILGIFVIVYSYFASREIILILFGDQWEGSVRSLQLLSLSVWAQMLASSSGSIFQSLNKTKLMMISGFFSTATIVIFIISGILLGNINSVAMMVSLAYIIVFFQVFYVLIKYGFNKNFFAFFLNFKIDFMNFIFISIAMYLITSFFEIDNLLLSALFKFGISACLYLVLLVVTKQHKYILGMLNIRSKFKSTDK